jgi:3'-phosphoadenosine 5'-phosphosulfate sulfotransferase (PAPS reductase)/FAD synthetase
VIASAGPNLADYDYIVLNSSAGKDSQTMLRHVVEAATAAGVKHRVIVVHADLGRVEWPGCPQLAKVQTGHYGVRFEVVKRAKGDLLDQVRGRGKWPSSSCRYCTSDQKRDQIATLLTRLSREAGRPVRILNCLGMRAEESPSRAKYTPFQRDARHSNSKRIVDRWLPIHSWSVGDVWDSIHQSRVPHHYAYDLGMPRLSCCFCIFSPRAALLLAGKHNRELLEEYVQIEREIKHQFRQGQPIEAIAEALAAGQEAGAVADWKM